MSETTIDRLQIEISSSASNASAALTRLESSLKRLQSVTSSSEGALGSLANSMSALQTASAKVSSLTGLTNLAKTLEELKGKSTGLNSLRKALEGLDTVNLTGVAESLGRLSAAAEGLSHLGDGLESIKEFRKGINSLSGSLEKLKKMDLSGVADKINELVAAIKPLTDEMVRAGSGVSNFGTQMRDLSQAMRTANNTGRLTNEVRQNLNSLNQTMNKTFSVAKLTAGFLALRKAAEKVADSIENINSYIEDVNLFTVAMGESAQAGAEFAQRMQDVLGIDAGEAMRNMGLFYNLTESFGVASDQAEVLSKNMTQLGYDFSSFYNLSIEESFTKLQAAISGEMEPIRRLGVDISQTRLQQELFNLGINESVSNLSQADKSILRYIAIMKQSGNAMGDFARTLNTPANMLRVFQAQLELAARAIGSLFIPALTAILPVAIAVVKVITALISTIAGFFGFEMPEIDWDTGAVASFGTGLEDVSDGLDDVAGSAANAKKQVAYLIGGFDELNVLSSQASSGGGGAGGGTGGMGDLLSGIELPEYDMFASLVDSDVEKWVRRINGLFEVMGAEIGKAIDRAKELAAIFKLGFHAEIKDTDFKGLLEIIQSIGTRLKEIFTDPKVTQAATRMGNRIAYSLGRIAGSIVNVGVTIGKNLFGGLDMYLEKNSDRIKEFLISMFDIAGEIAEIAANFTSAFAEVYSAWGGEDGQAVTASIIEIFANAFMGVVELAGKLGRDILNGITLPITENADAIKTALEEGWISPMRTVFEAIAGFVTNTFKKVHETYDQYVSPAISAFYEGWSNIASTVLDVYNTYFVPVFDNLSKIFSSLVSDDLQPLVNSFIEAFGTLTELVSTIWKNIFVPFVQWFHETYGPDIAIVLNIVGTAFMDLLSLVSTIVKGMIDVLSGVHTFLTGVFSLNWKKAWDGIAKVFSAFANGLGKTIKAGLNIVIDAVNFIIRKIPDAINRILRGLNSAADKLGINNNLPTISVPQIPRLAKGAIISPNDPFLAVLGDQKKGTNIEAPEGLIRDLFREEMENAVEDFQASIEENGSVSSTYTNEGSYELVAAFAQVGQAIVEAIEENRETTIVIGRDSVGKAAVDYIHDVKKRTGRTPV